MLIKIIPKINWANSNLALNYQMRTLFSGDKYNESFGSILKALYHASIFLTTPFTRYSAGA